MKIIEKIEDLDCGRFGCIWANEENNCRFIQGWIRYGKKKWFKLSLPIRNIFSKFISIEFSINVHFNDKKLVFNEKNKENYSIYIFMFLTQMHIENVSFLLYPDDFIFNGLNVDTYEDDLSEIVVELMENYKPIVERINQLIDCSKTLHRELHFIFELFGNTKRQIYMGFEYAEKMRWYYIGSVSKNNYRSKHHGSSNSSNNRLLDFYVSDSPFERYYTKTNIFNAKQNKSPWYYCHSVEINEQCWVDNHKSTLNMVD